VGLVEKPFRQLGQEILGHLPSHPIVLPGTDGFVLPAADLEDAQGMFLGDEGLTITHGNPLVILRLPPADSG